MSLRRYGDVVDRDIDVAGFQRRNQSVKSHIADIHGKALCLTDGADHIHVKAHISAGLGVLKTKGRIGGIHPDNDGFAFPGEGLKRNIGGQRGSCGAR